MESYNELDKKELLSRWYEYVDLCEREWTMINGEIVKIPNNEIAKAYCKVLLDIYKQIEPYADEIRRDYEANQDDEFLQKAANGILKEYKEMKSLIDTFHLEDSDDLTVGSITIPSEYKSDFVFTFGNNEFMAKSFLKDLYDIKRERQIKAEDVVYAYTKYHGKLSEDGGNYMAVFNVIGKKGLGLYLMSYPALTRVFREKL